MTNREETTRDAAVTGQILGSLKAADGFVSGEVLAQQSAITRSGVWKQINKLRRLGYQIEGQTRLGYKLVVEPDIFNEQLLRQRLLSPAHPWIKNLVYEQKTQSTNLIARRAGAEGAVEGTLFLAERQTAGRGRRGREWVCGGSDSLAFSVLQRPPAGVKNFSAITLVAGLAVAQALNELLRPAGTSEHPVMLKWPNDLISVKTGRKIGGILVESIFEDAAIDFLIIGIGLNLHQRRFDEELKDKATSLALDLGTDLNRLLVLERILEQLEQRYRGFLRGDKWLPDYEQLCLTLHRPVRVLYTTGETIDAVARSVDLSGSLCVEKDDGETVVVTSADVSIR